VFVDAAGISSGCVLPVFCNPDTRGDLFPYWHRHLAEPGFAEFEVRPSGPRFAFHGAAGPLYEYDWSLGERA
jgi:hypothetical protein